MKKNELDLLRKMYKIRELEKKIAEIHKNKLVGGTDHLSTGHEAVAVGLLSQISKEDIVTSGHRSNHILIGKGLLPYKILAEIFGKQDGYNRGYAGIMHISSKDDNFWGANGIVSANIPISVGIALAMKMQGKRNIVITFFGDGSTTNGVAHEAFNTASLYKVPILFVCENNLFAQSTYIKEHSAVQNLAEKINHMYGIKSKKCEGSDINNVIEESRKAISYVRKNKIPFFLEFVVYRSCGHSMGDPDMSYMTKSYRSLASKKDPVKLYESYLLKKHKLSNKDFEKIKNEAIEEIKRELERVMNAKSTKGVQVN